MNVLELEQIDNINTNCVHCGFCLATCPTYLLTGEEMNSPRGRIYLIKDMFKGQKITEQTVAALDKCLLCRSCETTCPSGVQYHQLLNAGRHHIEKNYKRTFSAKITRIILRKTLTTKTIFNILVKIGKTFKILLPRKIKAQLNTEPKFAYKNNDFTPVDRVLFLENCVQPALAPNINNKTHAILNKLNIKVSSLQQCCGAIDNHLGANDIALKKIKANIDSWYNKLTKENYSYIIGNVSGCGLQITDYAEILTKDQEYSKKAQFISAHYLDISEYLIKFDLSIFQAKNPQKISLQIPCSITHGGKNPQAISQILTSLGFSVPQIKDSHLCCGSAGTYSILQPTMATELAHNKLKNLLNSEPQIIISANIGCINHLQANTKTKVRHWIELLV